MSPGWLRAVWHRVGCDPPVFYGDEAAGTLGPAAPRLAALGVLRLTAPATAAACPGCGGGAVERVVWVTDRRAGRSRAYVPCPGCGPVPVPLDALARWAVDVPGLLARVAAAGGLAGSVAEVVPGSLWRAGRAGWGGRSRDVLFARRVHPADRAAVAAAVGRRPAAVLLVPTEDDVARWDVATHHPVGSLEALVGWGIGDLTFDAPAAAGLCDAVGGSVAGRPRRPRKRAARASAIEALTTELVAHLRAARDHARDSEARTGVPVLLPRPLRQELARTAGVSASAVSRCFRDPAARELRILWEVAADLDRVLGLAGPARGPTSD